MTMTHPGLPGFWGLLVIAAMAITMLWALVTPVPARNGIGIYNMVRLPVIGHALRYLTNSRWILFLLKVFVVTLFMMVIYAGLFGSPIPERNLATVLTWNIWWTGLVFSVFFLGSAWCAVCPWDAIATWLVRRRLWKRAQPNNSLNLRVPKSLKSIWPALLLFIGLTWLELGVGITTNPYATALVSLLMVVMATTSLAVFERKAFCRYFCPVGRTVGFYSQLAPLELRPINTDVCADCTTLECYHGDQQTEGCPTWLVMGRLTQNSYCTSCGNCTQSCPHHNIAWRLRSPSVEALQSARPRWDEAWFMLGLLALTGFHGVSMMPFWEQWMSDLARTLGDSGQLLTSFTLAMLLLMGSVVVLYVAFVAVTRFFTRSELSFKKVFSILAFVALPLAFSYHMAHNLNHLVAESGGVTELLRNPLGTDLQPLSILEKHQRQAQQFISRDGVFALQAALMVFGFWIAVQIIRYRGRTLLAGSDHTATWRLLPMLIFVVTISGFHLWLLMQPMLMRM